MMMRVGIRSKCVLGQGLSFLYPFLAHQRVFFGWLCKVINKQGDTDMTSSWIPHAAAVIVGIN